MAILLLLAIVNFVYRDIHRIIKNVGIFVIPNNKLCAHRTSE